MKENLVFNQTFTVEQFCRKEGVDYVDVLKNPKTGKLFFTYGSLTGAVSSKGVPTNPLISSVTGDEGTFYLMHNASEGLKPLARFKRRED